MGTVNQETDVADWPHLYENRLQWAFDAREAFLSELGSEAIAAFANSVSRSDRREVVVLGESQVGKTTLILRMHGVRDPDSLKRIESVLRGGRGYGNSATSVATEFRVAPGNRFRIQRLSDEEPEALTDEAACKRLATLRDEVEAGQKSALHQIRIEIPRNAGLPECRRQRDVRFRPRHHRSSRGWRGRSGRAAPHRKPRTSSPPPRSPGIDRRESRRNHTSPVFARE